MKRKENTLLVDNPIDLLAMVFGGIAVLVLYNLMSVYTNSEEYPSLSSDSFTLLWKGLLGISGMITTRLLLQTKKGHNVSLIANTFNVNQISNFVFATATYFGIQIAVILLRQTKIFQVEIADVYAFYFAAAVVEEILYRGFLVMLVQALIVRFLHLKDSEILIPNIIAMIISASVFAFVHQRYWSDPYLMILTFTGGLMQSYWYLKTKNLTVVIMAHAAVNITASGSVVQSLQNN